MRKFIPSFFFLCFIFGTLHAFAKPFQSPPVSQINVNNVSYSQTAPGKFVVTGDVQNPTPEPREIVVRGLLSFYDQSVAKGDAPLFSLRKDTTIVLAPSENRTIEIQLINEGKMPRLALRIEPVLRVRRQRVWNY